MQTTSDLDARVLAVIARFRDSTELAEALKASQVQRRGTQQGFGGTEAPSELPSRCVVDPFFISRNF